jgi:acetyltransferase-like isoleucine patch superfamily enzyme
MPSRRSLSSNDKVVIGDNVWQGEFVTILAAVTIREDSIIGANSVVNRDVLAYSIAFGARKKWLKSIILK